MFVFCSMHALFSSIALLSYELLVSRIFYVHAMFSKIVRNFSIEGPKTFSVPMHRYSCGTGSPLEDT